MHQSVILEGMPWWLALWVSISIQQEFEDPSPCLKDGDLEWALVQAGEDPNQWGAVHISLRQEDASLVIGVFSPGHKDPVAEKTLPYEGNCDDVAASVAVILAAAKTELPAFVSDISLPASPVTQPKVTQTPTTIVAAAPHTPINTPEAMPTSLHLAGGVTAAGATMSGTIAAIASLRPMPSTPLEMNFGFRYNARAETPLARGLASWDRWTTIISVEAWLNVKPGRIGIFTGPQLSLLSSRGRGYEENKHTSSVDAGAALGTHFVLGRGAFRPCLGVQANRWFGQQGLSVQGANVRESVPRWDVFASIGFFYSIH